MIKTKSSRRILQVESKVTSNEEQNKVSFGKSMSQSRRERKGLKGRQTVAKYIWRYFICG